MPMQGWGWDGGYGWSPIAGILMMLFWVAVIVAAIWLVVWLVRRTGQSSAAGGGGTSSAGAPAEPSAMEILQKRYARGEIDKAEFDEKKKDLSG